MGKEIKINSNDLIEIANELGDFLDDNGINHHQEHFGITALDLKCLIGDYLFKKYKLTDDDDYFSSKYDTDMRFVSCAKCGKKMRLAEAESINAKISSDSFALSLADWILVYRHDDWYCIGCYRYMPKQEIEKLSPRKEKRKATKGYVYFLSDGNGYTKIGKTVDVGKRIDDIGIKLPKQPVLLHSIFVKDYTTAETTFHEHYKEYRKQGEWFKLPDEQIEAIQNNIYPEKINELLAEVDNNG